MHEGYDCDDVHLESMNLVKYFGPIVGLISSPSGPFASKNTAMFGDLDEEVEIAKEVLKVQFILNKKTWVPHYTLSLT